MTSTPAVTNCFVICPIGDKHAELGNEKRLIWERSQVVWEEVIFPACGGVGLEPIRSDQISEPGDITEQILRRIRDSTVVIADLTGANANVMYELGLRHSRPRLTIQIGELGSLPFDVASIRTIMFKRSPAGLIEARRNLVAALAAGLDGRYTPVAATRIWLEGVTGGDVPAEPTSVSTTQEVPDEVEEPGTLEVLAEMEPALEDMNTTIKAVGSIAREIGEMLGEAKDRIAAAGGPNSRTPVRLQIAQGLAKRLEDPVVRLETTTQAFVESVRRSDAGARLLIKAARQSSEQAELASFRESVHRGVGSILGMIDKAEGLAATLGSGMDATRDLRKVTRRVGSALGALAAAREALKEWVALAEGAG